MAVISNKVTVYSIQTSDPVSASIANSPHGNLENNIDNLMAYLKVAGTGYFEENLATTTGLTWGYRAGIVRENNTVTAISAGTLALTASNINYVEVDGAGAVTANIVGFTTGKVPLWQVTTNGSTILDVQDRRTFATVTKALDVPFTPTATNAATNVQTAIVNAESNAAGSGLAFAIAFS